ALHASAFVVHCNNQGRAAHGVNLGHELDELLRVDVVAGEENHPTHQRMPHQLALLRRHDGPEEIDHQRPEAHAVGLAGSSRANASTCVVCGNMSTTPAATSLIPCSCTSSPRSRARLPG